MTERLPKLGVIGCPIGHSKSPLIYNYWFDKYKIKAEYNTYHVLPEDLEVFIKVLQQNGFIGLNVTVPHKINVMPLMSELSLHAQKAGAVNVIFVKQNGELIGHNTDGIGFLRNVTASVPTFDITKSKVVLLGTGGAARGICAAMVLAGVQEIRLVYRNFEKAKAFSEAIGGNFKLVEWKEKEDALINADLLVNATTLGMTGFEELDIDLTNLNQEAIVTDIVYAPLETHLLKTAKAYGYKTVDGLGMLLYQACPAFEQWFNIRPEVTQTLRDIVLK